MNDCKKCKYKKSCLKPKQEGCNEFQPLFAEGSFENRVLKNADALIESGVWEKIVKEVFK